MKDYFSIGNDVKFLLHLPEFWKIVSFISSLRFECVAVVP